MRYTLFICFEFSWLVIFLIHRKIKLAIDIGLFFLRHDFNFFQELFFELFYVFSECRCSLLSAIFHFNVVAAAGFLDVKLICPRSIKKAMWHLDIVIVVRVFNTELSPHFIHFHIGFF